MLNASQKPWSSTPSCLRHAANVSGPCPTGRSCTTKHLRNGRIDQNSIDHVAMRVRKRNSSLQWTRLATYSRVHLKSAFSICCHIPISEPAQSCYLIIFACSAAIQVTIDDDLLKLGQSNRLQVRRDSGPIACVVHISQQFRVYINVLLGWNKSRRIWLLALRLQLCHFFLIWSLIFTPRKKTPMTSLVNGSVPTSGEIKECIVCDYVTSRMKGSYFLVSYNDTVEDGIVTEDDMEKILKNRFEWDLGNRWINLMTPACV